MRNVSKMMAFPLFVAIVVSASDAADNGFVAVVQPFVVSGDDSNSDIATRIDADAVARVFAQAGVDIHFLEERAVPADPTPDGRPINVIERFAVSDPKSKFQLADRSVNLLFLDHHQWVHLEPDGSCESMEPRSVWTVALPTQPTKATPLDDVYLIAHAIGHALGLPDQPEQRDQHEVQEADEETADGLDRTGATNLMQAASAGKRASELRLNAEQIQLLRRSPHVQPRIDFLDQQTASIAICDDRDAPYFSRLHRRELATLTGETLPDSVGDLESVARQRFEAVTRSFTERETDSIRWCVDLVRDRIGKRFGLLRKQPYRFIKVANTHCGGFSHTRGPWIILSQATVDRFVAARHTEDADEALRTTGSLLVHEQLHVLQRFYPQKFGAFYANVWNFLPAQVALPESLQQDQILNPDALTTWILTESLTGLTGRQFVCLTVLKQDREVPRMGRDFLDLAVEVRPNESGNFVAVLDDDGQPRNVPLDSLSFYAATFQTERGLDHPNELAAYLFQAILVNDVNDGTVSSESRAVAAFGQWCAENLQ